MSAFVLDPALLENNILLGRTPLSDVLLADNAAIPWFVLVPHTTVVELCDLDAASHLGLFEEVNLVARAMRDEWAVDKLNIAAIGNIVRQLHIHVVGRRSDDDCWPAVVWGRPALQRYTEPRISELRHWLSTTLGSRFTPGAL